MGPSALSSILDSLASGASLNVLSRSAEGWDGGGADFGGDLRALAAALIGYGLNPGARVAVLGSEGRDVLCAELAVFAAGATLVSLDPALTEKALSEALATTAATQAIAGDEQQLARILALRPDLPALDLVLLMRAEPSERKPAALLARSAMDAGRAALVSEPSLLRVATAGEEQREGLVVFDAQARSRTVSLWSLTALARDFVSSLGLAPGRTVLSALPRGSVDRIAIALAAAARGATLLLARPGDRPDAGLVGHPADVAVLSPDALRRLQRAWTRDIEARSWLGRAATRWALRQGADPSRAGWKHGLADRLALRDLRGRLGGCVERLDVAGAGSGDREPATEAFFEAVGLPVRYLKADGSGTAGPLIAGS